VHKDDQSSFRSLLRSEWSGLTTKTTINDPQSANSNYNNSASTSASTKLDENRSKVFNARFKVKKKFDPEKDDKDDDSFLEDFKQDKLIEYLNLQISARLSVLPADDITNNTNSSSSNKLLIKKNALVCVARRLPLNNCESSYPVEQFSTELDLDGKVLDVDTTGLNDALKNRVQKMLGKHLHELVLNNQVESMKSYLSNICKSSSDTSVVSDKFNLRLFEQDELV